MTLHWDKVDASRAPKLWAEERTSETAALDGDDVAAIEALFAQEPPRQAPASTSARRGSERRAPPSGAALLDPKRAQQGSTRERNSQLQRLLSRPFPLVLADSWTSDRLSERSRRVDAFFLERARAKHSR